MHRLASQLASIKISLDPPSPPHSSAGFALPHFSDLNESSSDANHLQVPVDYDTQHLFSPPPDRRCSLTSITSDHSSITLSRSSTYQSLLLPVGKNKKCPIDVYDTSNEVMKQPKNHAQGVPIKKILHSASVLIIFSSKFIAHRFRSSNFQEMLAPKSWPIQDFLNHSSISLSTRK
ncbi:hypothetical protein KIN20_030214 [Parelaphostrongylus tenuis]|uniref:Uncharacterized protein n=1 Tax=Parelaphostrongylus tenuis TaxID=148309 RepID=A0AAD5R3D8_PARTN|nr:hypothetical protein KIN20_030214 [Parelaphostrongylus tenuis]